MVINTSNIYALNLLRYIGLTPISFFRTTTNFHNVVNFFLSTYTYSITFIEAHVDFRQTTQIKIKSESKRRKSSENNFCGTYQPSVRNAILNLSEKSFKNEEKKIIVFCLLFQVIFQK